MLAISGIFLIVAAVFGGYLLEHGNIYVLMQPAEVLIVVGAAVGITLLSNRPAVIRKMFTGARLALRPPPYSSGRFLRYLRMLYEVFSFVQRSGMVKLEDHVENPEASRIFAQYPEFLEDRMARHFICDSLRMLVIGVTTPAELDHLMDLDIDVQRRGYHESAGALSAIAEALPGLGIIAAVLGVVITMQAIGGSPETVGQKVAAALVGTLLGILLCYGVVGPIASRVESLTEQQAQFLQVLRIAVVSFARGASPILAVEYARRSIPEEVRPPFVEMEAMVKGRGKNHVQEEEDTLEKDAAATSA